MADPNSWRFRSPTDPIYPAFRPPPFPQLQPPPPPWERPAHPPPPPFLPYPNPPPFGFGGGAVDNGRPPKRPRCEDPAAEDERRLNLVRFHGGRAAPPSGGHEWYHSGVHGGPYDHRAPLRADHRYPMAPPDWRSGNRPAELPHPWGRDRYDGGQFGVRSPLPPLPSHPYPPCPPLPPPSQPGPSPASAINSPISPFKDPVGVAGHHYSSVVHLNGHKPLTMKPLAQEKLKKIDASHLFKHPQRVTRPDHLVVILRGLPGSGKSYLAKLLRDVEVENGGKAPRIHSMDDYFMTEVEKVEEIESSKTSSQSVKGKKKITKKVMEYCYEPEMEEAYRASMLKAFKKTLEEGIFTFIIGMKL